MNQSECRSGFLPLTEAASNGLGGWRKQWTGDLVTWNEQMAAAGDANPIVIPEQGFKVACLFCYYHGLTTHHALVDRLDPLEIDDFDPELPVPPLLLRAYHVVNVSYDEQIPDQRLPFTEQQATKTLDLYCTMCASNVGVLETDTTAGYGNIGNYFIDFKLFDWELEWLMD